jgi:hypothetical protein
LTSFHFPFNALIVRKSVWTKAQNLH